MQSMTEQTRRRPVRTRIARSHTADEWKSIKPHFTRLYITENKPLKEVQRILERDYEFSATKKMWKTHITTWHIGKHRSERQVIHGMRIFRRAKRAGRRVSMTIKGIPTTLEDLLKHLNKKGIDESSVPSPRSATPTSIEYCEYEEDPELNAEEEEPELEDDDDFDDPSSATECNSFYDDQHGGMNAPSRLNVQHSTIFTRNDRNKQFNPDANHETFERRFERQLTLSDESMSGDPSEMGSEVPEEVRHRISQSLRRFLSETLPHTRPQSSYFTAKCPGPAALEAYDEAIKRNDKNGAVLQYRKGLEMMEQMMKVPNPFCIVYVCELMRIALMSKDAAMPEKMLDYVTHLPTSPLTIIISSVMKADDEDGPSRISLLRLVYENAMEIIKIDFDSPDNVVFGVLNNRYAILCSQ